MNKKKWLLNTLYVLVTLIAFSLSMFKFDNPIGIAAWIAPVFLMRFMRNNKWLHALVSGFVVLLLANIITFIPQLGFVTETSMKVSFDHVFTWQLKSGSLFLIPFLLIPFILDKALYKRLPKLAATVIYPATVVFIDLFCSYIYGIMGTVGDSQYTIQPLMMITSLIGIFGLSFLVAWFAPMVNLLWEEKWKIKSLGLSGLLYISVLGIMLVYGGITSAFPAKAEKTVPVAGITTSYTFYDNMSESDLYISEIFKLNPSEYAELMHSPDSHLDEMRQKTKDAVKAGAKIIIWQEFALTLDSSAADSLLEEMRNLADTEDVYLLVSYGRILNENEKKEQPEKNMSVLFTPDGTIGWEYAKAFPGPGIEDEVVEAGPANIPYLDTPYGRIGQATCFEMLMPHYLKQAAVKKIDLLLVPAMDGAIYSPLLTNSSAVRGVEYGFTMVRVAGLDGYSAVIDPYYRTRAGQDINEHGAVNFYANVPVVSGKTFYATIGFVFPYIITLLLISLIVLAIIRAKKISQSGGE